MPTELSPLRERLLVRKDSGAERIGRLIVPDSVRKPQTVATVISTGRSLSAAAFSPAAS